MGEYKEASIWMKVSVLMLILGFYCLGNGFSSGTGYADHGGIACFIVGFLCFLTAVVLVLGLVFLDELKDSKPAQICLAVFAFIAGIATIIGVAVNHGALNKHLYSTLHQTSISSNTWSSLTVASIIQTSYASMYEVMAGFMAVLAGIFGSLEAAGVKAQSAP